MIGLPSVGENEAGSTNIGTNTHPVIILNLETLRADVQKLSVKQKSALAFELGFGERATVKQEALQLSDNRDISKLLASRPDEYIRELNPVITNLLLGMANVKSDEQVKPEYEVSQKRNSDICLAAETVIELVSPSILPYHFREFVLLYTLTKSRLAVLMLSSSGPFGSYQSVKSWLHDIAKDNDGPALEGDVLAVFDNNQIMQRRWQITQNNVVKSSVITMLMFFHMDKNGLLQKREDLKPINWFGKQVNEEEIKYIDQDAIIVQTKFEHLYIWLDGIIKEVAAEQVRSGEAWVDEIDDVVKENEWKRDYKMCRTCEFREVPKRARLCPRCRSAPAGIPGNEPSVPIVTAQSASAKTAAKEVRVTVSQMESNDFTLTYEDK